MLIKGTLDRIFTLNTTLKDIKFDTNIFIEKNGILSRYSLGGENADNIDEIDMIYKPNTIKNLKYIYHVKKIGGGLRYEHLAYTKLTLLQHIQISFFNRFLPWILKVKTLFRILTIVLAIMTILIGREQIKMSKKIQQIEVINTVKIK